MTQPAQQSHVSETPSVPPGRVTRTLLRWLMRPARVAAVETLSPHFRLIDLEGEALRNFAWIAGQKIQISIGSGLSTRTYTPVMWDAGAGRMQLLAFIHGEGPGCRWVNDLRAGDVCQFFGPRRSLDLSGLEAPVVLFGDETSFGLAASFREFPQSEGAVNLFEVSDLVEARRVLEAIGLGQPDVIARSMDDARLGVAEAELLRHAATGAQFVLTGKSSSIQRISRALKAAGVASARLRTKAYWAPGKTGLD